MYIGNNLDNWDKEKLLLMLQVRQVISLVTSYPYLPFCRHIIPIHFDRKYFWVLFLLLIKLYPCNNVAKIKRLEIYFSMLFLFLVLTLTKILTVH